MPINPALPSKLVITNEVYSTALPSAGFVRLPTVAHVTGVAKSTVWKWVASGKLPKPIKISPKVSAWPVGEIRAWLNDPIAWQSANRKVGG